MFRKSLTPSILSLALVLCLSAFAPARPRDIAPTTPIYLPIIQHSIPLALTVLESRIAVGGYPCHYPYQSVSIEGIVENANNANAGNLRVRLLLYSYWWNGPRFVTSPLDLHILGPRETSPFSVPLTCWYPIDSYTIESAGEQTLEEPYRDLMIVNENTEVGEYTEDHWGEVDNAGSMDVQGSYYTPEPTWPGTYRGFNLYTVYYDAAGKMVARTNLPLAGHLGSGMTTPFRDSVSRAIGAVRYERWIDATPLPPGEHAVRLQITVDSIVAIDGQFVAIGQVKNLSAVTVESFTSYAVFRDAQGAVIDFRDQPMFYPDGALGPGDTQPFKQTVASTYQDPLPQYHVIDIYGYVDNVTSP